MSNLIKKYPLKKATLVTLPATCKSEVKLWITSAGVMPSIKVSVFNTTSFWIEGLTKEGSRLTGVWILMAKALSFNWL